MKRCNLVLTVLAAVSFAAAPGAAQQFTVGSGASFDLGTGSLGLGCADLTVAGTMSAGTAGFTQARNVTINSAGTMNGNSALLEVAGNWANAGSFNAGSSTVQMVDGCGLVSAVISGNTTFANLDLTTTSNFLYEFAAGSTQTVLGMLALMGASGNLLMIGSTVGGNAAFLNVVGSSIADFVDVEDNDATQGNVINLTATSLKGPNTPGWSPPSLPAFGLLGLGLLALSLLFGGRRALATRGRLGTS